MPAPSAGEAIGLQFFRPDADVQIALARRPDRLQARSGTTIEVRGGTMTGRFVADLTALEGDTFSLAADVPASWIIDSVESAPAGDVIRWNRQIGAGQNTRLHIAFDRAIRPAAPFRLVISGRWRRPPLGARLRLADLKMVTLNGPIAARRLIAIHPEAPYQLEMTGADLLKRFDPNQIDLADAELVGPGHGGLAFVDNDSAADLQVEIGSQLPRYSGSVQIDARVEDTALVESYRLTCTPESAEVDRLLVHFSRRRGEPPRWSLAAAETESTHGRDVVPDLPTPENATVFSTRQLTAAEQAALGVSAAGETWELTLHEPRATSFVLEAIRGSRLKADTPVSLAWLPQAAAQQGSVIVRSTARLMPEIVNRRLKPIPAPAPPTDGWPSALAAYQYDPQDEIIAAATEPKPSLSIGPGSERPAAWCWSCRLESRFWPDGTGQHAARWRIENSGRSRVSFEMPAGATFDGAWIDPGAPGSIAATYEPGAAVELELPAERRFVTVVLRWTNAESPLSIVSSRAVELPRIDMPVMARQWHVSLPPRFRLADEPQNGSDPKISASQRLFGPLGRSVDVDPPGDIVQSARSGDSNRAAANSPWSPDSDDAPDIEQAGWATYDLDLPPAGQEIRVIARDAFTAIGCGLFLFAAMLVWWKGGVSWQAQGAALAAATALALAVPPYCAALGAGLWLGLVGGWLLRWLAPWDRPVGATVNAPTSPRMPPTGSSATGPAAGAVLLILCLSSPNAGHTAEPALAEPADNTVWQVVIPTDDKQPTTGHHYLVPEPFYNELVRRAARSSGQPPDWMIAAASYRGGFVHAADQTTFDATDWSALYELELLAPRASVRIPFGGDGVNLLPDGVTVDGRAVPFQWEAAKKHLVVDVSGSGHHLLSLAFRPAARAAAGGTTVDLAIPPLAMSRLELSLPTDAEAEVPSACGKLALDRSRGRLSGQLGPAEHLTIRCFGEGTGGETKPAVADADELMWLKVRPGSVVLETRIKLRMVEGALSEIQLLADPRLRRLPLAADSGIARVRTERGAPHTIYAGLAEPATEERTLSMSFLLTDTSGIGNLRLPQLDLVGLRRVNRRLAVSIESPLESAAPATGTAQPIAAGQFLAAWGPAETRPQLAWQFPPGETIWNLPVQYGEPQLSSRDSLAVMCERERMTFAWSADLAIRGGNLFQIRLPAPPDLVVDEALLRQPGAAERPIRWARPATGGVTLFLPGAAPEHSTLLVRGSMPCAANKVTELPPLRIDGCRLESQSVVVLRGTIAQVTLADSAGLKPLPTADVPALLDKWIGDGLIDRETLKIARPVICLTGKPGTAQSMPSVRVAPNAPRVTAAQTTTMRRAGDLWTVQIDLDLNVSGGAIDVLRFDLPAHWSGPSRIEPDIPSQIVESSADNHRQLVLRPSKPIVGFQKIAMSGPVTAAAGERVRVPDVRPLGIGRPQRMVLLPTRSAGQQFVWEASGLNVAPLPARISADSGPEMEVYRSCQVAGLSFEAALKSVEKRTGEPSVRLADIGIAIEPGGNCYGVATFDLEPAGSNYCVLEMPADYSDSNLVDVRVNGLPAVAQRLSESPDRWRIALGSGKLPQRIEVPYVSASTGEADSGSGRTLHCPVLVGIPVEQTLWSVAGLTGADKSAVSGAMTTSRLDQEMIRLKTTSQLIESAAALLAEEPADTIARWYVPWAQRLRSLRDQIERRHGASDGREADATIAAEIDSIDKQQGRLAGRLETSTIGPERTATRPLAERAIDLWSDAAGTSRSQIVYYTAGDGTELILPPSAGKNSDLWMRLAVAFAGAAIAGLLCWLGARPGIQTAVARWPQSLGIAVGFVWWFCLAPSWLGPIIVAISIISVLRQGRATGPPHDAPSPMAPG